MPRKRVKRQLIREVLVYCEGKTEKHYIDGLRQWVRTLDLGARVKIKAGDVKGGGYGAILNMLRKEPDSNCVARVVLLDFDRYKGVQGEDVIFNQLVAYSKASMRKAVPCILVVSNANFEHAPCLHDTGYHESGSAASFLLENWGYRNLNDCKSDERIWEKAHSGDRDHAHMVERMRGRKLVLKKNRGESLKDRHQTQGCSVRCRLRAHTRNESRRPVQGALPIAGFARGRVHGPRRRLLSRAMRNRMEGEADAASERDTGEWGRLAMSSEVG